MRAPREEEEEEEAWLNSVRAALLPGRERSLRIDRYERPLVRQFDQAMQELRALQRQRLGREFQAPPQTMPGREGDE